MTPHRDRTCSRKMYPSMTASHGGKCLSWFNGCSPTMLAYPLKFVRSLPTLQYQDGDHERLPIRIYLITGCCNDPKPHQRFIEEACDHTCDHIRKFGFDISLGSRGPERACCIAPITASARSKRDNQAGKAIL